MSLWQLLMSPASRLHPTSTKAQKPDSMKSFQLTATLPYFCKLHRFTLEINKLRPIPVYKQKSKVSSTDSYQWMLTDFRWIGDISSHLKSNVLGTQLFVIFSESKVELPLNHLLKVSRNQYFRGSQYSHNQL